MSCLGLDFGAGNSVVAEWAGAKSEILVKIGENGAVRSDVIVGSEGKVMADPTCIQDPPNNSKLETSIKRRLISALDKGDQYSVNYLMQLASSKIEYIYKVYWNYREEKIVKVVLTCPANTGQAYRDTLLHIGRQIGLPSVDIVDEPTAAAVHHGLSEIAKRNERWMVGEHYLILNDIL